MKKYRDISGMKFNRLTAIELDHIMRLPSGTRHIWKCLCECGNEIIVRKDSIINGHTKSCGCHKSYVLKNRKTDLIGKTFGRLVVLSESDIKDSNNKYYLICRCSCGITKKVGRGALIAGVTLSCGCLQKEVASSMRGKNSPHWKLDKGQRKKIDIRMSAEYKDWRDEVFKIDNYTCACCETPNGYKNAHHIESFSKLYNESNKDALSNVDNGITLCYKCHKEFHKQYGRHNNNENQLWEFISNYKMEEA